MEPARKNVESLRRRVAVLPVSERNAHMRSKRLSHRYGEHPTPVRGCPDCELKTAERSWGV